MLTPNLTWGVSPMRITPFASIMIDDRFHYLVQHLALPGL
jgi:hypothetical protein